ncbi:MAG: HAD family hydrolase [Lachnospiraceae bacterium]|nr:HAD family hydrolase [Lachnospiraceae bacterium]
MKAVFLDRDGTINIEKHYLYKIEDFEFILNAIEGLKLLQQMGYMLIIVTNQSGIGRGYYTEEAFLRLNNWMLNRLEVEGIHIEKVYYCPHLPGAKVEKYRMNCKCRKPSLGMYEKAIEEFEIELSKSFAIGDKIRDCEICFTTDCRGFLIDNNESTDVINRVKLGQIKNVQYANDLYECAKIICKMDMEET